MSHGQSNGTEIKNNSEDEDYLREGKYVCFLRSLVLSVLVVAASILAGFLYTTVANKEQLDFLHVYEGSSDHILEEFQHAVDSMVIATGTVSSVYTSRYVSNSSEWPFVTLPHFREQFSGLLGLSKGRAIEFSPIVTEDDRVEWEEYAVQQASLVNAHPENLELGISRKDENGNMVHASTGNYTDSKYQGLYSPIWQVAPMEGNSKAVFFDMHSQVDRRRALDDMIQYKIPTLTPIIQLVQDVNLRPSAVLFCPVFNNFDREKIVGSALLAFNWDTLLQKQLPRNVEGIIVVLETNVGQYFSYRIHDYNANFIGEGDHHDPAYDDHQVSVQASLSEYSEGHEVVRYTLHVYPSAVFEAQYRTNAPAVYTVIVILIFAVTCFAFLSYDYIVAYHRKIIVKAARRSRMIANSLFPDTVRDRLFSRGGMGSSSGRGIPPIATSSPQKPAKKAGHATMQKITKFIPKVVENPALKMKRFLLPNLDDNSGFDLNMTFNSDPIADFFPSVTVIFADIAGFTSWSSSRDPVCVFKLLEKLYGAFDKVATRMGVFKISTIGDCYWAVTGLPDERYDHAEIMAEFALECRHIFSVIKRELAPSLGRETMNLELRCGLHSGPVMAGVLRGVRSRFEMFGDTVNTASRMESTGTPKKIQLSEQTADLLKEAGKESWVVARDDLVTAKGKGRLQTYWLVHGEKLQITLCSSENDFPIRLHRKSNDCLMKDISEKTVESSDCEFSLANDLGKQPCKLFPSDDDDLIGSQLHKYSLSRGLSCSMPGKLPSHHLASSLFEIKDEMVVALGDSDHYIYCQKSQDIIQKQLLKKPAHAMTA